MRTIVWVPPSGCFGLNMELWVFPDGCSVRSLHAVLTSRIDIDVASITPRMGRIDPNIRIVFRFAMKLMLIMQFLFDGVEVRIEDLDHRSCGNMVVSHDLLLFKSPWLAIVHLSILFPGNIEVCRSIASTAHHFTFMMVRRNLPRVGDEQRRVWVAAKISSCPIEYIRWRHNTLLKIRGHDRRAMTPIMPLNGNMVYSMDFRSASTFWKVMVLRAVSGSSLS